MMTKGFVSIFLILICFSFVFAQPIQDEAQTQDPPAEAIRVCAQASDGDDCSFVGMDGETVSGVCRYGIQEELICEVEGRLMSLPPSQGEQDQTQIQETGEIETTEEKGFFRRIFRFLFGWMWSSDSPTQMPSGSAPEQQGTPGNNTSEEDEKARVNLLGQQTGTPPEDNPLKNLEATGVINEGCIEVVGNAKLLECSDEKIVIESNGIPEHEVMRGISEGGWNGQWTEAQDYTGDNAFFMPGTPFLSVSPTIIHKNTAGVAANGIPIFLPQSPGRVGDAHCVEGLDLTGTEYEGGCIRDAVAAGEMDVCGGHTGRGNDYHYHAPPTCLMEGLDDGVIVGYMLDGLPIYESVKEGSENYNECGGYVSEDGEVYYAFADSYPYISDCILGEFHEGPHTDQSEVDTGDVDTKAAGSIVDYYNDDDGCAHMSFSSGATLMHCFNEENNH